MQHLVYLQYTSIGTIRHTRLAYLRRQHWEVIDITVYKIGCHVRNCNVNNMLCITMVAV